MDLSEMQELGLTKGEISVYEALLEIGIGGLSKIQEKVRIERHNIYDILNKLIEKGLVSYTLEKRKKTYQCTHPQRINELIKNREDKLKKIKQQVPDLVTMFSTSKPDVQAEVYRGTEAIKSLLEEMLLHKQSLWIGGTSFNDYNLETKGLQLWFGHWMKRRIEKKHKMYDLVDQGTYLKGYEPDKNHEKKFYYYCELPKELSSPLVICIFGNKVAQILWGKQTFALVIESEELKKSYMKYFDYFWKD